LRHNVQIRHCPPKMLCLLSPAKTLAEASCGTVASAPATLLAGATGALARRCGALSRAELKKLMAVSDALATLNHARFAAFAAQPLFRPAAKLFDGPAFKALSAGAMREADLLALDRHLVVLSGLYGLVRPGDAVRPYRLEMGTKLDVEGHSSLYEFWAAHGLTDCLLAHARSVGAHTVVNVASQEYAKVVDMAALRARGLHVLDVEFIKSGGGAVASVYAKQARGMVARFVAMTRCTEVSVLEQFTGSKGNFAFSRKLSKPDRLVFEMSAKPAGPGDEKLFAALLAKVAPLPTREPADAPAGAPAEAPQAAPAAKRATKRTVAGADAANTNAAAAESADAAPPRAKRRR
jgi:cytoplasmic iron level regulating protein YaaA (DUF328/UPF0246 family)